MSRVGNIPIDIPEGVRIEISPKDIKVIGEKGELVRTLPRLIEVDVKDGQVVVAAKSQTKKARSLHGTYRALIANMIKGVTDGWEKTLELVGTGYRAQLEGKDLVLNVGYSHPVKVEAIDGISFKVEKAIITISGTDKEVVGKIAAEIRDIRPPEPYKGKGIRYQDEQVRRKPGKAAKAAGSPA